MQRETPRILSLNPGTRYLGVAVLYGTDLREWAVKILRGGSVQEKMTSFKKILSDLVARYGVTMLAIKKFHPSRCSGALRNLTTQIKTVGRDSRLFVHEYSLEEVKAAVSPHERVNKRRVMEEVVTRYAFLFSELEREKKNKHPYLIRMFEAVAIGILCTNELDSKNRKVGNA